MAGEPSEAPRVAVTRATEVTSALAAGEVRPPNAARLG
jgi:hypothetical protein